MLNPEDFTDAVVLAYFRARSPLWPDKKLTRGESRSVSSEVEDLLAHQLVQAFPGISHAYINQTLTSVVSKADGRLKPDITLCQGDEARIFIDLKMDLGYKREEFANSAALRDSEMRHLRGKKISLRKKIGNTRVHQEVTVWHKAVYVYVVVTDTNIDTEKYKSLETRVKKLHRVRQVTLVRGTAVNLYDRSRAEATRQVRKHISKSDFAVLNQLLRNAVA